VTALALRQEVEEAGGVLRTSRGQLVVKAPVGMLRPDLISALRTHKVELLALLDAEKAADVRRRAGNALSPDAMADEAELCIRGELP
jgi:hypothetical protein